MDSFAEVKVVPAGAAEVTRPGPPGGSRGSAARPARAGYAEYAGGELDFLTPRAIFQLSTGNLLKYTVFCKLPENTVNITLTLTRRRRAGGSRGQ